MVCASDPAGDEHPGIERRADHGIAVDQQPDLLVAELPAARHQGAAVVVAGQYRAVKDVQRLEEACVGQMRRVEDHAQLFEFLEQLHAFRRERPIVAGADRVAALAVMSQVHRPQARGSTTRRPDSAR